MSGLLWCVCVCSDNGTFQGSVPSEGGFRSSVASSWHHILLLISFQPSWKPWTTNGPAEQGLYTHPAAPGVKLSKIFIFYLILNKNSTLLTNHRSSLQDWERKHKQVVTVYRSHLLAAVQVSWRHMPQHKVRRAIKRRCNRERFLCVAVRWTVSGADNIIRLCPGNKERTVLVQLLSLPEDEITGEGWITFYNTLSFIIQYFNYIRTVCHYIFIYCICLF